MLRGGSWISLLASEVRVSSRVNYDVPSARNDSFGFRCAGEAVPVTAGSSNIGTAARQLTKATFSVAHEHFNAKSYLINQGAHGNGLLIISDRTLRYAEAGAGSNPEHDFDVPCSDIVEAGMLRAGAFHIRLLKENYVFGAPDLRHSDKQRAKLILSAVADCRGK